MNTIEFHWTGTDGTCRSGVLYSLMRDAPVLSFQYDAISYVKGGMSKFVLADKAIDLTSAQVLEVEAYAVAHSTDTYAPVGMVAVSRAELGSPSGAALIGTAYDMNQAALNQKLLTEVHTNDTISAVKLGLSPTASPTTNTSRLIAGIDACIAKEVSSIHFDSKMALTPDTDIRKASLINFTGVQQEGLYRTFSTKQNAPDFIPSSDITPSRHLNGITTATPVVMLLGDSISTSGPDSWNTASDMFTILCDEMARKNPDRTFTFLNRAIGGQRWTNLLTRPEVFPAWYGDSSQLWLDAVKGSAPDIVFLAFGMNDSNGFAADAVRRCVNAINSWPKVPKIIFITNPLPARTTQLNDGFGFVGPDFQEGRDNPAGWVRSWASVHGYGVIDIHRAQVAMRDGYDVSKNILVHQGSYTPETLPGGALRSGAPSVDWSILGTVLAGAWPVGKVLSCKTGSIGEAVFVSNVAGKFAIVGFSDDGATVSVTSTKDVPTGTFEIGISVVDNMATVVVDRDACLSIPIVRRGGRYNLIVGWQDDLTTGPFNALEFSTGYPARGQFNRSLTDEETFGPSSPIADRKPVYGGNGVNHYSSVGVEKLVRPVIEAADLTLSDGAWERNEASTLLAGIGTVVAYRRNGMVQLEGLYTPSANAVALFQLPAGFRPPRAMRTPVAWLHTPYSVLLNIAADGMVQVEAGWIGQPIDLSSVMFSI